MLLHRLLNELGKRYANKQNCVSDEILHHSESSASLSSSTGEELKSNECHMITFTSVAFISNAVMQ